MAEKANCGAAPGGEALSDGAPTGTAALRRAVAEPGALVEALAARLAAVQKPRLPAEHGAENGAEGATGNSTGNSTRDAAPEWEAMAREFEQSAAAGSRMRVPEYYLSLIEAPGDPIWRQAVPNRAEQCEEPLPADPLAEDDPRHAPVPHLTHRYPGRALLLVTDLCPMYCRFCMRKRKTLRGEAITPAMVNRALAHIRENPVIHEVILSGGDPLMLPDARLEAILSELGAIPHVQLTRLHTRMPCVEPGRITRELAQMLARHQPLWLGVHFNHPREVTPQAQRALALLADAGLPLNNQTVLLRGVNDDAEVLAQLFRRLMRCQVHPYYLHHSDLVPGTAHLRLTVQEGLRIVRELRALAPELANLHYVLDTPGGGGKVPLEG